MLYSNPFLPGALALAVLAAIAAPARGEDFSVASGAAVAYSTLSIQQAMAGAGSRMEVAEHVLGNGLRVSSAMNRRSPEHETQWRLSSFSLLAQEEEGAELAIGIGYPASSVLPEANAGLIEVSRSFGNAALSVSMSQTRESRAYPGSWPAPALSSGSHVSTSALQVAGAWLLAPRLAVAGQAAYGVTPGMRSSDSLTTEISTARTNAFSLALVAADRVKRGDRLSVSLSQPMRTYSGKIAMDVLSHSSGSGAARERLVFSMVPIGREMRARLNYQMPAGYGATFGFTLMVRRNPNNLADVPVEALAAVRYVKAF